jgi:hypothetical protein
MGIACAIRDLFVAGLGWADWYRMLAGVLVGPRRRSGEGNLRNSAP